MPSTPAPHAVLLLQERRIVHANNRTALMSGLAMDDLIGMELETLLQQHFPNDLSRIERLFRWAEKGEHSEAYSGLCLTTRDGGSTWIDFLLSPTFFEGAPAVQMVWIDNTPRLQAEARLSEIIWRLQILQDINRSMLTVQDDAQTAQAALRHISYLANDYHSSTVHLLDTNGETAFPVASDSPFSDQQEPIRWEFLVEFPENLSQGLPQVISDLVEFEPLNPVLERLFKLGVRSLLVVPMCWDGDLHGLLSVYSASPGEFPFERVQAAQEIANLLAVAFKHTQLKQAETERRLEAEAVNEIYSAALLGGETGSTLPTVPAGLQRMFDCDWVWLFLRGDDGSFWLRESAADVSGGARQSFAAGDPLIQALEQTHQPLVVSDILSNPHFQTWLELEPLRSWLGAPLLVGEKLTGFLTLASSQPNAFTQLDVARLGHFAGQIAPLIAHLDLREKSSQPN